MTTVRQVEMRQTFTKPVTGAIVGAALMTTRFPNAFLITSPSFIAGSSLPPAVSGAILGFIAPYVADGINSLINGTDRNHQLHDLPSFVTAMACGAATFAILPMLLGQEGREELKQLALLGVITETAAQWVHENFVLHEPGSMRLAGF